MMVVRNSTLELILAMRVPPGLLAGIGATWLLGNNSVLGTVLK